MKQYHPRPREKRERSSAALATLGEVTRDLERFSLPQLRNRIDNCYALLISELLPNAIGLSASDRAEAYRLAYKLDALRERLVHSYFGRAQLASLQAVFHDLDQILEQEPAGEDDIPLALTAAEEGATPATGILVR